MAWRTRQSPIRVEPPRSPAGTSYLTPYREQMKRVGSTFEALLWTSRQTQSARFEAVTDMIDLGGRTVLDAGCGLGDFAVHLDHEEIDYARYIGIDALEPHLDAARARAVPRTEFHQRDFVADPGAFTPRGRAPDVIVFSGSLNTLDQPEALAVLERAWHACSHALAFNFLVRSGIWRPRRAGPIRRFDPTEMLKWALERTAIVAYRQDYLQGDDGTIVMWTL